MGTQLKSALEQLAFVTRHLPEPVVIADGKGYIVAVNDAARKFYGDFSRKNNRMYEWPRQFETLAADGSKLRPEEYPLNRAVFGEATEDLPLIVKIDGHSHHVRVTATPIMDGEKILGAMAVHRIEEQK